MSTFISVAELARIVHPRGSRLRLMALLQAYFDASFTDGPGTTSIGGYVGTEEQWIKVEKAWQENLNLWGIEYFHLAELLSGNTSLGREKGELCALSFARIIYEFSLHHLVSSFRDADWADDLKQSSKEYFPESYHICLDMVLKSLSVHMQETFPNDFVAIVMDRDTGHIAAAEKIFWITKQANSQLFSLTYADRRRFPLLQCPDLLAGEERKAWLSAQGWTRDETRLIYEMARPNIGRGSHWSLEIEAAIIHALKEFKGKQYPI